MVILKRQWSLLTNCKSILWLFLPGIKNQKSCLSLFQTPVLGLLLTEIKQQPAAHCRRLLPFFANRHAPPLLSCSITGTTATAIIGQRHDPRISARTAAGIPACIASVLEAVVISLIITVAEAGPVAPASMPVSAAMAVAAAIISVIVTTGTSVAAAIVVAIVVAIIVAIIVAIVIAIVITALVIMLMLQSSRAHMTVGSSTYASDNIRIHRQEDTYIRTRKTERKIQNNNEK